MSLIKQQQNSQQSKKRLRSQASVFFNGSEQISAILPEFRYSEVSSFDSFIQSRSTFEESFIYDQLPQKRSLDYIKSFVQNYQNTQFEEQPQMNFETRFKYFRAQKPQPTKSLVVFQPKFIYYQYKRPNRIFSSWSRGTRVVHNQTTELNLKLNEIDDTHNTHLIPEIVRLILTPVQMTRHLNTNEVVNDAVHILIERIWAGTRNHKIYAQICHKTIYSYEYGSTTTAFYNGITKELKYAFQTLQFDISYHSELWKLRVISTCQFIGLMFINGTYPKCFIDECFAHCMEKILLAQTIPSITKRDAWTQSWFLALLTLQETVGFKLEQQSQLKDEKVSEGLTNFITSVQEGIVAQLKVSNSLIFSLQLIINQISFENLKEHFTLNQVVLSQIDDIKYLRTQNWLRWEPTITE